MAVLFKLQGFEALKFEQTENKIGIFESAQNEVALKYGSLG